MDKTTDDVLRALIAAIYRYCDRPGCNDQSRRTRITQLRWHADEAARQIGQTPPDPDPE